MSVYQTIAFASDAHYAIPSFLAISSIFAHALHPEIIQVIILATDDYPSCICEAIACEAANFGAPEPRLIEMHDAYASEIMHISHVTRATYFRLMLPSLLIDTDICLYLDADTICVDDIGPLFNIDMQEYLLAGVKAAGYYYPPSRREHNRTRLGLPKFNLYVNAGVLLMNLTQMRKQNLEEVFLQLLSRNYHDQDQDILNVACYDQIRLLEPRYNLMTKYPVTSFLDYKTTPLLSSCYEADEWRQAIEHPCIIHYADRKKPWLLPTSPLADYWWKQYEQSFDILRAHHAQDQMASFCHEYNSHTNNCGRQ